MAGLVWGLSLWPSPHVVLVLGSAKHVLNNDETCC
jgi:hypothetical protein